jgi:hypothetical protein
MSAGTAIFSVVENRVHKNDVITVAFPQRDAEKG